MIQMQTNLDVADNSGARRVQCIKVWGFQTQIRLVGDIIVVSVKEAIPRGRVKKGDVRKAVVVRTAKESAAKMALPSALTATQPSSSTTQGTGRHPYLRAVVRELRAKTS